eukprot:CAMPEP_0119403494 /NCGR_PEP_ID=MMETSP1334-20130426/143411_1 /TAXON_ID=127549 /ORGANISM="Calcidiscus leptoporus, Strain RCC1130" /LENGTH=303 /DNA_ID=CAMNT_0007427439 /DNA_START=79 /DNA_END=990 /DNA_ORIENTATION=+
MWTVRGLLFAATPLGSEESVLQDLSAMLIQSGVRRHRSRLELRSSHSSAGRIQAAWRRRQSRATGKSAKDTGGSRALTLKRALLAVAFAIFGILFAMGCRHHRQTHLHTSRRVEFQEDPHTSSARLVPSIESALGGQEDAHTLRWKSAVTQSTPLLNSSIFRLTREERPERPRRLHATVKAMAGMKARWPLQSRRSEDELEEPTKVVSGEIMVDSAQGRWKALRQQSSRWVVRKGAQLFTAVRVLGMAVRRSIRLQLVMAKDLMINWLALILCGAWHLFSAGLLRVPVATPKCSITPSRSTGE